DSERERAWRRDPSIADSGFRIADSQPRGPFAHSAIRNPQSAIGRGGGVTRVAVVGGGAWGTALADLLARKGELEGGVTLWAREPERLSTPSCVLAEVLPKGTPVAVLSGPSFAQEVYARQPTAVVAAARDHAVAQRVQHVFSTTYFRVYSATDVIGVELAGALKNV